MALQREVVSFGVKELALERTEVTIDMDYAMKFGPIGWALNKALIQPTMKKVFVRMLKGLNQHTVTGELVDNG